MGGDGIIDRGVDDSAVKDSVASPKNGLTISGDIPGCPQTRADVFPVAGESACLRNRWVWDLRGRQKLRIPTQAETQCQARADSPVVLYKERQIIRIELESGSADSLSKAGVTRDCSPTGRAERRMTIGVRNIIANPIHARIV